MEADDTTPSEGERDGGTDGERDADELVTLRSGLGVTEAQTDDTTVPGGGAELHIPPSGESVLEVAGYAYDDEGAEVRLRIRTVPGSDVVLNYACSLTPERAEEIGAKLQAAAVAARREHQPEVSE
jgi:hypothetical protein